MNLDQIYRSMNYFVADHPGLDLGPPAADHHSVRDSEFIYMCRIEINLSEKRE